MGCPVHAAGLKGGKPVLVELGAYVNDLFLKSFPAFDMNPATVSINYRSVGQRLKAARARLNKTQKEMAEAAGIPFDTYQKYEGDSSMPGGQALGGLALLGVDLSWILTGHSGAGLAPAAVDANLLVTVIEGVNRALGARGIELGPDKHAQLIALVYDHFEGREVRDERVYERFLRLIK